MLGAGAVGPVSALKFKQEAMLQQLVIADAVSARASLLADRLNDPRVSGIGLNAGDRASVARTIRETGTTIVLNAALPVTNLQVMCACLDAGCDYIDLASGGETAEFTEQPAVAAPAGNVTATAAPASKVVPAAAKAQNLVIVIS